MVAPTPQLNGLWLMPANPPGLFYVERKQAHESHGGVSTLPVKAGVRGTVTKSNMPDQIEERTTAGIP